MSPGVIVQYVLCIQCGLLMAQMGESNWDTVCIQHKDKQHYFRIRPFQSFPLLAHITAWENGMWACEGAALCYH